MNPNKDQIMSLMSTNVDDNLNLKVNAFELNDAVSGSSSGDYIKNLEVGDLDLLQDKNLSCWHYWQDYYYPHVIRESYPVYIREQAQDKGRKAFEIIKMLKDKKIIKLDTVSDFIDAMDELIKII